MKIKAKWGFRGDAPKLNARSADVKAGDVFDGVDPEYGHALVGKGLVVQIHEGAAPQETKPVKPGELKGVESGSIVETTNIDGATGAAGIQSADGEASGGAGPADSASDATAGTPAPTDQGAADDRALLIQQLEAAGVEFDRRWGAARLAAALAEVKKNEDPA